MMRHLRSRLAVVVTALLSVGWLGCGSDWATALIRDYNEASIVAFRTGELSKLEAVASEDEARKVVTLVDLKKSQNLVLESSLDALELVSTNMTGKDGAIVETRETWTYQDRPLRPGDAPGTRFVARMKMRYDCSRTNRVWKVSKVVTLSNEFLEPRGFELKQHRAHGETRPEEPTEGTRE